MLERKHEEVTCSFFFQPKEYQPAITKTSAI